jgi:hypothetical protein
MDWEEHFDPFNNKLEDNKSDIFKRNLDAWKTQIEAQQKRRLKNWKARNEPIKKRNLFFN